MSEQPNPPVPRLASLDAYRGFIMLVMASAGFGFAEVYKKHFTDSGFWKFLGYEFDHVPWTGCAFWDLIQPSFMFMVGVAIPFSHASRVAKGQSSARITAHVIYRSVVLILLGIFLSSNGLTLTNFTFVNVLTQIGLGYAFVYVLLGRSPGFKVMVLITILVGYWYLFFSQPVPSEAAALLTTARKDRELWFAETPQFMGFAQWFWTKTGLDQYLPFEFSFGHWNKNANFAAEFDYWFLNLFPRTKHFNYNEGGYQTLNFIPSVATMILGLMAGELLRSARTAQSKFSRLFVAGALCLVVGLIMNYTVCPSVKRIWTPTWAVFSAGWTFWMLAGFFLIIDVFGYRRWAFPLVIVGMNSIAVYCMSQLWSGWIARTLKAHLGWGYHSLTMSTPADSIWQTDLGPDLFGGTYGPIVQSVAVLSILWLFCFWMYRRGIFLRI